jgi:hypothetical protein
LKNIITKIIIVLSVCCLLFRNIQIADASSIQENIPVRVKDELYYYRNVLLRMLAETEYISKSDTSEVQILEPYVIYKPGITQDAIYYYPRII